MPMWRSRHVLESIFIQTQVIIDSNAIASENTGSIDLSNADGSGKQVLVNSFDLPMSQDQIDNTSTETDDSSGGTETVEEGPNYFLFFLFFLILAPIPALTEVRLNPSQLRQKKCPSSKN